MNNTQWHALKKNTWARPLTFNHCLISLVLVPLLSPICFVLLTSSSSFSAPIFRLFLTRDLFPPSPLPLPTSPPSPPLTPTPPPPPLPLPLPSLLLPPLFLFSPLLSLYIYLSLSLYLSIYLSVSISIFLSFRKFVVDIEIDEKV